MLLTVMCMEANIVTRFCLAGLGLLTLGLYLSGPVGVTVKVSTRH